MSFGVIGNRTPRIDSKEQVTGKLKFANDIYYPDMLYMKGLFSTEDHAKILTIDTYAAESLPGVAAVLTHKDVPYNATGFILEDQVVLPKDKVLYRGQLVALVAAETEAIAEEAIDLIKVYYERLPAVFDPKEAMKEDAPILHEDKQDTFMKGNVITLGGQEYQHLKHGGDIEDGFAQCDVIVEQEFATPAQRCAPIEPHVFLAVPNASGGVHVQGNTQCPHNHQEQASKILKMSLNNLRVSATAVGGGFGQKNGMSLEPYVALMANKTGRPVKWALSTAEDFHFSTTRCSFYMKYKLGAKKDGTLVAIERTTICNTGAYGTTGVIISGKATKIGSGVYKIPYQDAKTWLVYTNKNPAGAMRGFGMTQPTFAMECIMDVMAEKLGMDPIEFRMRNILCDGDTIGTGQELHSCGASEVLTTLRDQSGWVAK
jgi:CO/xanthine dehydrogenase Mo-binding subunit